MDKDKLIEVLMGALDEAGQALADAELETQDSRKAKKYAKAIKRASDAILVARKHG